MCKLSKEDMQVKIYTPMQQLKDRFYNSNSEEEWNENKEELVELLAYAEEVMDAEFYTKYKDGVINSIKKMYDFKVKYWKKSEKKAYAPKSSYIFREEEGKAFIALCEAYINYLNRH